MPTTALHHSTPRAVTTGPPRSMKATGLFSKRKVLSASPETVHSSRALGNVILASGGSRMRLRMRGLGHVSGNPHTFKCIFLPGHRHAGSKDFHGGGFIPRSGPARLETFSQAMKKAVGNEDAHGAYTQAGTSGSIKNMPDIAIINYTRYRQGSLASFNWRTTQMLDGCGDALEAVDEEGSK